MRDENNKVVCFEDQDGDILQVELEADEDGDRYVAVISAGDEQGVNLNAEQQVELANTLLGIDNAEFDYRAKAAREAGAILRTSGGLFGGVGGTKAVEVIALAEWIAYGDPQFAGTIEALAFGGDDEL